MILIQKILIQKIINSFKRKTFDSRFDSKKTKKLQTDSKDLQLLSYIFDHYFF